MTQKEYSEKVRSVLFEHSTVSRERLLSCLSKVPSKAESGNIQIFVDQDGEGFLDVRFYFEGPDWSSLQEGIREVADLFETKVIGGVVMPDMPLVDPFFNEEFSLHELLPRIAAEWIRSIWLNPETISTSLPIAITVSDDVGSFTPIRLN